jgi:hypothetical protein
VNCWVARQWQCRICTKSVLNLVNTTAQYADNFTGTTHLSVACQSTDPETKACQFFSLVDPVKYCEGSMTFGRAHIVEERAQKIFNELKDLNAQTDLSSEYLNPGKCAVYYIPVESKSGVNTSHDERTKIQELGAQHKCHTCCCDNPAGQGVGKWIADHQPPTALLQILEKDLLSDLKVLDNLAATVALNPDFYLTFVEMKHLFRDLQDDLGDEYRVYPHCGKCSLTQSSLIKKIKDTVKVVTQLRTTFVREAKLRSPNAAAHCQNLFTAFIELGAFFADGIGLGLIRKSHDDSLSEETKSAQATPSEKQAVQVLGGKNGCHSCPVKDPRIGAVWIADHQPPTALVTTGLVRSKQYLYPQCADCSSEQSKVTNRIARRFEFLSPESYKK